MTNISQEVDNPFAFPFPDERDHNGCGIREGSLGMTLRDWFAGQALAMSQPDSPEHLADWVYRVADAMLAERSKS